MELMIIENDVNRCRFYDECGVERIFIDIERLGKNERQGHLSTVISDHEIDDIKNIKPNLKNSEILLRINPLNPETKQEVDSGIDAGANIIMLPMFKGPSEVREFIRLVDGRVKSSLLLETPAALFRLDDILEIDGIDEIHIGLNDMHLALGLDFMLEIYKSPILELACKKIKNKGISLGIGGIAPIELGDVKGRYVLTEALRLGCERMILSRAFPKDNQDNFKKYLEELRNFVDRSQDLDKSAINIELIESINKIIYSDLK